MSNSLVLSSLMKCCLLVFKMSFCHIGIEATASFHDNHGSHLPMRMTFQVLPGRLCLGSLVHRRTAAAKDQHSLWVNIVRSQRLNTSKRREGTKAAWATQTCLGSPPKGPKLVEQKATQHPRYRNRQ
jgi:hypothetical protein